MAYISSTLREYEESTYLCNRCCFCHSACTILRQMNMEETSGPRGKMPLVYGLIRGDIKLSAFIVDKLYLCTTCRHCYVECPAGLEVEKVVEAFRHELIKAGLAPLEAHKVISFNIDNHNNPFGESVLDRVSG